MLARKVGVVLKIDKTNVVDINKSVRVLVIVDIKQPLKQHVKLKLRGGETMQIPIKYERIPLFYGNCGRMEHGHRDYEKNNRDHTLEKKKFNVSIRTSPWRRNTNDGAKLSEASSEKAVCNHA